MAVVATRNMRFHPYASKTAKFGSPMPATPLFNSTTLDSLSVLADVTPLMISNITLSPITPSGRDEIFRGEEVMSCDFKRSKSFRRIRDLCKLKPRRKIQLWKPEENKEVLESTRISESSVMVDSAPMPLPILPRVSPSSASPPEVKGQGYSQVNNKGQLKVSIYVNSGLLTIHVIQGRHFMSKWKSTCDSYIKVELIPGNNPGCQTDIIPDTNHPMFDEKFSFELLPEDVKKRVLISVYHKTLKSSKDELLGSMSFGLQNITRNKAFVNGWYYLLSDSVGRRKHLQLSSGHLGDEEQHTPESNNNTSPMSYKTHALMLRRGSSGYGFTVTGGCPAKVCRVDPNGPADMACLRSGDVIMRINKEKVHSASTDGVARIIKHCSRKVLLEVHRPQKHDDLAASPLPWKPAYNDLDSSMSSSDDDDDDVTTATGWYGDDNKENSAVPYHLTHTLAHRTPAHKSARTPAPRKPVSHMPIAHTPPHLIKPTIQRTVTFRDFL